MPKTRIQKEETVKVLTQKLADAKSVVFADYRGLNMSQLSTLRNDLRDQSAEFSITKNNLLEIALKDAKIDIDIQTLEGPTATLFSFGDEIAPIKALTKIFKDTQIGKVKGGLLNGEQLDTIAINKLSTLPSKDELKAKVVGSLGAPLYGIVGVLQANIRNLVYVMDAIRKNKGGE